MLWPLNIDYYSPKGDLTMNCPVCGSREIGKLSKNQYFCRNCFREIKVGNTKIQLSVIAENGRLLSYKSLANTNAI